MQTAKTGGNVLIPAITLNSSSAIGVDDSSTLNVNAATGDATGGSGIGGAATASLSKVGTGTETATKLLSG